MEDQEKSSQGPATSHEVSATRLYLGNLARNATKQEIQAHFEQHGTGEITEIKLMSGFGFIEYKDPADARDVVPAFHGSSFMGERLTVQFARGSRAREPPGVHERPFPRPRRTPFRMQIVGLPSETSWQDLKDFARQAGVDVVYSETPRDGQGRGFVEFETAADLRLSVSKLDGTEFKSGSRVKCTSDVQPDQPAYNRGRSGSPRRHGANGNDYDYRGSGPGRAREHSPRRDGYRNDYRNRSPRRDHYEDRSRYRSPRRADEHATGRPRYDETYRRDYQHTEPYANGRSYERSAREGPHSRDQPPREGGYRDASYAQARELSYTARDTAHPPRESGYISRDGAYPSHREAGYGAREYDRGRY